MMERNALNTNVVSYIAFILYKKFCFALIMYSLLCTDDKFKLRKYTCQQLQLHSTVTALLPSPHALAAYRMISFLLFTSLLSVIWMMWYRGQKNYPPGPRRVPLLGSIPFMTMKNGILDFLLDSSVTRNRISTIAVGPFFKLHIINDYELAKVNLILLMYTSVIDVL